VVPFQITGPSNLVILSERRIYAFCRLIGMPFVRFLAQIAHVGFLETSSSIFLILSSPLKLFFPVDCLNHIVEALVVDQPVDLVACAKVRSVALLVLPDTTVEVSGHTNVERLRAVRQNVDGIVAAFAIAHSFGALPAECIEPSLRSG